MPLFNFDNDSILGQVREVDTRRVVLEVKSDEDLQKAQVGQLAALECSAGAETWLIGIIEKVMRSIAANLEQVEDTYELGNDEPENKNHEDYCINTVRLTLVGTAKYDAYKGKHVFSRALNRVPCINARCYVLLNNNLQTFMSLISDSTKNEYALDIGKYALDTDAIAYLDGNKFFQRHASLLGSTGSGKSWTVASILEKAAQLPSSNLVVFDLHGEYSNLTYARHLRIPGPEDLGIVTEQLLYLPYWLLNSEELQAMFIDRSEFSAHNQVMAFQDAVIKDKRKILVELKKDEVLKAFTLDSPIPFSIHNVLAELTDLNEEMEQGARGLKQGKFYGQFSRLLTRIKSKLDDKRYGFLFQAPESEHQYEAMAKIAEKLMNYYTKRTQVKIIDFSEVPSEILPVIVGLVARIIYQVQFWTDSEMRRPIALICDEAHLYLPKRADQNPVEKRAVEAFERIAKEGRKYGVALVIISQRPSDVSTTILSQCNNVIALRLTNGDDQNTVKKLMPESLNSLLDILPIMDVGEALVVGDAILLPSRIIINPPKEHPISATIDFWDKWAQEVEEPDFVKAIENMRRQGRN
jgi:phosphoglycolate phosphatase-like HAD superfamily hydrolase